MLSVVMSVFNNEESIKFSIESILNQTFQDFEFIIINDASSDNSLNIIKKYAAIDKRIKIFNNNINIGLTRSLNLAIKHCTGELIARHDADDISFPNRFKLQLDFLERNPNYAFCGTNAIIQQNNKEMIKVYDKNGIKQNLLLYNTFIHSSIIIRKEILESYGYYNKKFKYAQDYELWCKLIYKFKLNAKNLNQNLILWDGSYSRLLKKDRKKFLLQKINSIIIKILYLKYYENKIIVLFSILINFIEIISLTSLIDLFFNKIK